MAAIVGMRNPKLMLLEKGGKTRTVFCIFRGRLLLIKGSVPAILLPMLHGLIIGAVALFDVADTPLGFLYPVSK
jgi:hypothetical protein